MSSRNVYLSPEQRGIATILYRALKQSAARLRSGAEIGAVMAEGAGMITEAGFALDYFEVRHAETLAAVTSPKDGPMRILVAAKLGTTRLIDNIAV
jgi:pantoate--beta-alanine ligase